MIIHIVINWRLVVENNYTGKDMAWTPLAGYEAGINLNDEPRLLTEQEITHIVQHLPIPHAADATAAETARAGIIQWLIKELKGVEIAPSGIPDLIRMMVYQHNKSLITPGTPVGILAAEAIGATTTQMTLNSVAPHERILIQDYSGNPHLVKIGEWINSVIADNSSQVQHIPENRTQYVKLPYPVKIATPDENGVVTWDEVTAVTKHLPVGDLVKVTTRSGREVTATRSKSLLVWDGAQLQQRAGSEVRVGDEVPVFNKLPAPPVEGKTVNLNQFLPKGGNLEPLSLDKEFGQFLGLYLATGGLDSLSVAPIVADDENLMSLVNKFWGSVNVRESTLTVRSPEFSQALDSWMHDEQKLHIPAEILLGNTDFIKGVLRGYLQSDTLNVINKSVFIHVDNDDLAIAIGILISRLGFFGRIGYGHDQDSPGYYLAIENYHQLTQVLDAENAEISGWIAKFPSVDFVYEKHNNIVLDPIVSVEDVPATEYVYDLTVPSTTNFSLWNGLGVADTFHSSGSAKSASFGIDAMRDIIFARKVPKNESSTIYFTDSTTTFEQALDARQYIVGSMVSDFVKDYDIDDPAVLQQYWWHAAAPLLLQKEVPQSGKVLRLFLNVVNMYKHRVSIDHLAYILESEVPTSVVAIYGSIADGIIDLYPHPNFILTLEKRKYGNVPRELMELAYLETIVVPELKKIRVKGIAGITALYPVVSPVWRMVMQELKMSEDELNQLLPQLSPGQRQIAQDNPGRVWSLFYNHSIMRKTGLVPGNLATLLVNAGVQIIGGGVDKLIVALSSDAYTNARGDAIVQYEDSYYTIIPADDLVTMDNVLYQRISEDSLKEEDGRLLLEVDSKIYVEIDPDTVRYVDDWRYLRLPIEELLTLEDGRTLQLVPPEVKVKEIRPNEYVSLKVSADKKARRDEIKRQTEENIKRARTLEGEAKRALIRATVYVERSLLLKSAEFIIAETDGNNLKELLALPGIDKRRTTCNNMHTITDTLGIEATRSFIVRALSNTISNTGSYVHPTNIMVIAEFVTSRGQPHGATFTGISRQPGGHLSLATLERAGTVFIQNAIHGRTEDIRNVSASIAVGARMSIGTGFFDIGQDITVQGVPKRVLNDDLFTALEHDDATLAIERPAPIMDDQIDVDALADIAAGLLFDDRGADNETNLNTTFLGGEAIPDFGETVNIEGGVIHAPVRRVAPLTKVTAEPVVARDLVNVLDQIKIGIPVDTAQKGLAPVELTRPAREQEPRPIESSGLVTEEFAVPMTGGGLPPILLNMLMPEPTEERATVVVPLPVTPIEPLPEIANLTAEQAIGLRQTQIEGLDILPQ